MIDIKANRAKIDVQLSMNSDAPVIVVTGGNRGIGLEICNQLAERGAQVVLTSRRPENGEKAVEKLAARNLVVRYHSLDVTSGESIATLAEFLKRGYGRLDVLINNAGLISKEETSALEVNLATVRETWETNTLAPLRLSQEFAPILRGSRRARIVNVSSGRRALGHAGRLCGLPYFQGSTQCSDSNSRRGIDGRRCRQFGLPGLGQDRYGWHQC